MSQVPEALAEVINEERASPRMLEDVLGRLEAERPDLAPFWEFLSIKDRHDRHAFSIQVEHAIFRRLGWRLMRPLFIVAIIAAAASFLLMKQGDPTLLLAVFLSGAAALYLAFQVFLHLWAWRDVKKLTAITEDYRRRLATMLGESE